MKVNDYEISKNIELIISQFNFSGIYKYLALLAHPEMPDQDIDDLKLEASKLLYKTLKEAIDSSGDPSYNFSNNFKATYLDGEIHLDVFIDFKVWTISDTLMSIIKG